MRGLFSPSSSRVRRCGGVARSFAWRVAPWVVLAAWTAGVGLVGAADVVSEARALTQGGQPEQAFAKLVDAVKANPSAAPALQSVAQEAVEALEQRAGSLQAAMKYAEALTVLKVAWPAINDRTNAALLFGSAADYNRKRLRIYGILNSVAIGQANVEIIRDNLPLALQYAQAAIDYQPDETNADARSLKAKIQEKMGDVPGALATLNDLFGRLPTGDPTWWLEVKREIDRLKAGMPGGAALTPAPATPRAAPATPPLLGPPPQAVTPAPAPRAPGASAIARPAASPAAASTPASLKESAAETLEKGKAIVQNVDVSLLRRTLMEKLRDPDYLRSVITPVLYVIGAGLLWWAPWFYIVRAQTRRGNLRASLWLIPVKRFGFVAFLIYVAKGVRFEKKEKRQRCPYCAKPIDDIEAYTNLNFYVCPHCKQNIKPVYDLKDYITHLAQNVERIMNRGGARVESPLEKDAMTKLVRSILTLGVRNRATDLHVASEDEGVKVRSRCDGMMTDFLQFNRVVGIPLISAIKIVANLDITKHHVPQDGKFSVWVEDTDIDIRINSAPTPKGDNLSLRLLDRRRIFVDSTKLGLEGNNLELFERGIRRPHGLILVTGPTGSGKSTTLYVALNAINTGDKTIITIEDPIEYELKGLKQLQVNAAQSFTFANGLRSILRQDPDVIMVGEVRDKDTAEIALDAAMTGHLVFTTLHTIDTATAIGRLSDLGVESRRYASALQLVIAQRLVRLACPECKKPYKPAQKDLDQLGIGTLKDQAYYRGAGCSSCNGTAFFGRIGVFECLHPEADLKEILETNATPAVIRELARKHGMCTLREEGAKKALQGLTPVEEIVRVVM